MIWKCGRWLFIRLSVHLSSSFPSFLTSRSSKVFGYVRWYDRYNLQYSAPQSSLAPLYPAFSPGQNLSMVRAVSPYLPWVLFAMDLTAWWGRCLWYTSWRDKNHSHSLSPAPQLLFSDTALPWHSSPEAPFPTRYSFWPYRGDSPSPPSNGPNS